MEKDYTKRELDDHFKSVVEKIDYNTTLTKSVDTRVGVQNGRVAKLEGRWNGLVLAMSIVVVLFGTISGLIIYSFNLSQTNLKQSILLELQK